MIDPKTDPPEDPQYAHAIEYLFGQINYEKSGLAAYTSKNYCLDRMDQLIHILGDPHLKYPVIHVAGTKGKGTVSQLTSEILTEAGFKTGLYSSPHLLSVTERFRIDGLEIGSAEFIRMTLQVRDASDELQERFPVLGKPTFFELTTAIAMLYFAQQEVDIAVFEVGLGGRLDSTNVCRPKVCVITSISLDHQKQLGDTIPKIAFEKAGIIKPGASVICSAENEEARCVVERRCEETGCRLELIQRDFCADWEAIDPPSNSLVAQVAWHPRMSERDEGHVFKTKMLGKHQASNIAAALAVIESLNRDGWKIPTDAAKQAIAKSSPTARLQLIDEKPLRILDTAHNAASIKAGIEAITTHFPKRDICVVFASSKDKNYRTMLRELSSVSQHIIVTAFKNNPRALPTDDLLTVAAELGLRCSGEEEGRASGVSSVVAASTPKAAWNAALKYSDSNGVVYVAGSFFLAAELLEYLKTKS